MWWRPRRKDYKVRVIGVHDVEYSEGAKRVIINGERMASGGPVDIYYSFLRQHEWSSPSGVALTVADKIKIKERIEIDLMAHGIRAQVELP